MLSAALTIRVFGIYLVLLGASLMIVPEWVLSTFGLPIPNEVWIRVVGMLAGMLGYYYLRAASAGLTPFFYWTVPARFAVLGFFGIFVSLGLAPTALLALGLVDAAGATRTWGQRFRQNLAQAGKAPMVIIGAMMRKLVCGLWRDEVWKAFRSEAPWCLTSSLLQAVQGDRLTACASP